ncbi:MAG: ADP compounds hydrolase NudE [Gammaproteobacteria bacterium]|nr:ADP compounds hydrolase NudE [Gammaproteobacteria bacterium]
MRKKPEIMATETLARTRLFHVEQLDLRFANGVTTRYERLGRTGGNGAVLIVPMRSDDEVLLIREYAAGVDRYELALPKGRIEPDESPLDAANRELQEETGYGARKLRHLAGLTVAPGYMGHVTQIILAEDLYESRLSGDEPEEIEVVPWSLKDLAGLIACEDCTEARSIAALFMAREVLNGTSTDR